MPLLLAVGHVTWDRVEGDDVLGGAVTYAAVAARKLGWDAAVLTSADDEFQPERDLPGIQVVVNPAPRTTRFQNLYDETGTRWQQVTARADEIDLSLLPDAWRAPDALLLAPVVGEIPAHAVRGFEADLVGVVGQGWLREIARDGTVRPRDWPDPSRDLTGAHVLFLSERDLPPRGRSARDFLGYVPMVAQTRGWEGLELITRDATHQIPSLPREEVDPTGAGDVLAGAFLVGYQETGDPIGAAAFAACAASCAVEGVGCSTLGDRREVERRLATRQRLIEEGEWGD